MRQVVLREEQDIFRPIAQRRQRERNDVEPIEQIFAETSRARPRFEIAIRRRNQPHVGLTLSRFAEPLIGPVVEKTQQARLGVRRQFADFVEKQCAAFGFLDLSRDIGDSAR